MKNSGAVVAKSIKSAVHRRARVNIGSLASTTPLDPSLPSTTTSTTPKRSFTTSSTSSYFTTNPVLASTSSPSSSSSAASALPILTSYSTPLLCPTYPTSHSDPISLCLPNPPKSYFRQTPVLWPTGVRPGIDSTTSMRATSRTKNTRSSHAFASSSVMNMSIKANAGAHLEATSSTSSRFKATAMPPGTRSISSLTSPLLSSYGKSPAPSTLLSSTSTKLQQRPSISASTSKSNQQRHFITVTAPIFSLSPKPTPSAPAFGEGGYIKTAAALIIGDEILNGKTCDTNSNYFAKYCFEHGIELRRIEVVADREEEIIEASRRMVEMYDFVITTGGIGPTHDDITYSALANAFDQPLVHHAETLRRMESMYSSRVWVEGQTTEQRDAFRRMALFPEDAEVLYVGRDIWVPVVRLGGKLCVFPGIPSLFQKMLQGLTPFLSMPPKDECLVRIQVYTERPESMVAPYLTSLQSRLKPYGIQIGSYPVIGKGVFVSLIGQSKRCSPKDGGRGRQTHAHAQPLELDFKQIVRELEEAVDGKMIESESEVARMKEEAWNEEKKRQREILRQHRVPAARKDESAAPPPSFSGSMVKMLRQTL